MAIKEEKTPISALAKLCLLVSFRDVAGHVAAAASM